MLILSRTRPRAINQLLGANLPKPSRRTFAEGLLSDLPDVYPDECPEIPLSAYYEPEADPDRPRDLWPPDNDTAYWQRRKEFDDGCQAAQAFAPRKTVDLLTPDEFAGAMAMAEAAVRSADALKARHPGRFGLVLPGRPTEPTLEDRVWWAQETERLEVEAMERQLEEAYEMSLMQDALEHGRQDGSRWEETEFCRVNHGRGA